MEDTSKNLRNRQNLIRMRDEQLAKMAELASKTNPRDAGDLLSRIQTLCDQIEGPSQGEYPGQWTPTQVITKHLARHGQSMRVPDLIDAIAPGYRDGGKDATTSLKKALGRFASLSGAVWIKDPEWANAEQGLLLRDGWVLLKGWDESYIRETSGAVAL